MCAAWIQPLRTNGTASLSSRIRSKTASAVEAAKLTSASPRFVPEMLEQPFRIVFQAGDDLAAIQPRCALADRAGLERPDCKSEARRVQGGRQAHDAAADDDDIDRAAGREKRRE